MERIDPLADLILGCLKCGSRFVEERSVRLVHLITSRTCYGLDPSDAGCDACLGYDPELTDLRTVRKMRTAAELEIERIAEVAYRYDSYDLAVLLAEDGRSAELLCFFDGEDLGLYGERLKDYVIYHLLDLRDLFGCHCLGMVEVESQTV